MEAGAFRCIPCGSGFGDASFTDSLLRFDMADELVLYVLPRFQGEGFRLFEGCPGFSLWELAGMRSFDRDVCRLHYRRVAGG